MGLQNICSLTNMSLSEKLEINIISLFDWGFIDKGGYFNVDIDQSGSYVNNLSVLNKVVDPRGFTVWQGPKNWVYEDGADGSGVNYPPVIYVDNVISTGVTINYRDGNVRTSGTPTDVRAEFSYKWVTVTSARKVDMYRKVRYRSGRTDLEEINGPTELFVPMPFISFEVPPITSSRPYGVGFFSPKVISHRITANVVGENHSDVTRICDLICKQEGFIFDMFNPQEVHASGDYPLNMNGTFNSGKNHDELVELYPWGNFKILSAEAEDATYIHENICEAKVRIRTEMLNCGCT
jgi:hypothetical protein